MIIISSNIQFFTYNVKMYNTQIYLHFVNILKERVFKEFSIAVMFLTLTFENLLRHTLSASRTGKKQAQPIQ